MMPAIRLLTLNPGHFHAALVQKEMYPDVAEQVHVYAPLGPDLLGHLNRIVGFNTRAANPTAWRLEVHAGPDYLERLLQERPGTVVVLAGRNRSKIDYLLAAVRAGLHVLADKPWIIRVEDQPKLAEAFQVAEQQRVVAYDIMTERYEITSLLQREFIQDTEVFGQVVPSDAAEPGVLMESMHYLKKQVAGVPLRRPPWFFDIHQQGEGLTDVGTHLVDLVPWLLFPGRALNAATDVQILQARRWPTMLTRDEFQCVTGEGDFPAALAAEVHEGRLHYFCNNQVDYRVGGIFTRLNVLWDYAAAAGAGDTHYATVRGTRARVEVRQGPEQQFRPELYVVPHRAKEPTAAALHARLEQLVSTYPGLDLVDCGNEFRIEVPATYRTGHEAHFAEVTRQFLAYLGNPAAVPVWETPNMLAKYHVTTEGVALSRRTAV